MTEARGVDDVGEQTRLDPMETVRPGKSRSDLSAMHEAKQARQTHRRSQSHEAKQARYT